MSLQSIIKTGAILVGVALVVISGCFLYTFYVRLQAEKCLQTMQQLRVGSSTREETQKILGRFRGFEVDGTAVINGEKYSSQTYRFENKGLHLLGIFHPARFQTGVIFRDGVVIVKSAGFLTEPFQTVGTRESVTGLLQNVSLNESPSGILVGLYDPPKKMDIFLDTRASASTRKMAYGYNLACFTSLSGCRSVYEILPSVKQQATK